MANEAKLSSSDNYAIAVFGPNDGKFCIVVGNVPEGYVPTLAEILHGEACGYFGDVIESGSAKGSVPGRWDAHVVVKSTAQKVLAFVRERLEGGPNQLVPKLAN